MDVRLDYGRTGLIVRIPDDLAVSIVEPSKGVPLADPDAARWRPRSPRRSARRRWPSWRAGGATRWS